MDTITKSATASGGLVYSEDRKVCEHKYGLSDPHTALFYIKRRKSTVAIFSTFYSLMEIGFLSECCNTAPLQIDNLGNFAGGFRSVHSGE